MNSQKVFILIIVLGAIGTILGLLITKPVDKQKVPIQLSPTPLVVEDSVREINITAKNWEFQPSIIKVKQGEEVTLKVTSVDVDHGISIPEFGINAKLEPHKETIIRFSPDKKGEFLFFCSILCGDGHIDMKGTLVVE